MSSLQDIKTEQDLFEKFCSTEIFQEKGQDYRSFRENFENLGIVFPDDAEMKSRLERLFKKQKDQIAGYKCSLLEALRNVVVYGVKKSIKVGDAVPFIESKTGESMFDAYRRAQPESGWIQYENFSFNGFQIIHTRAYGKCSVSLLKNGQLKKFKSKFNENEADLEVLRQAWLSIENGTLFLKENAEKSQVYHLQYLTQDGEFEYIFPPSEYSDAAETNSNQLDGCIYSVNGETYLGFSRDLVKENKYSLGKFNGTKELELVNFTIHSGDQTIASNKFGFISSLPNHASNELSFVAELNGKYFVSIPGKPFEMIQLPFNPDTMLNYGWRKSGDKVVWMSKPNSDKKDFYTVYIQDQKTGKFKIIHIPINPISNSYAENYFFPENKRLDTSYTIDHFNDSDLDLANKLLNMAKEEKKKTKKRSRLSLGRFSLEKLRGF